MLRVECQLNTRQKKRESPEQRLLSFSLRLRLVERAALVDVDEPELVEPNFHRRYRHVVALGEPIHVWPSPRPASINILAKKLPGHEHGTRVPIHDPLLVGVVQSRLQITDVLHALIRRAQSLENMEKTRSRVPERHYTGFVAFEQPRVVD